MIHNFLDSWPLFSDMYVAGWMIAGLLALVGLPVVARDQIFLGAALAQAATLGVALALTFESTLAWLPGAPVVFATGFAVMASLATLRAGRGRGESYEALTGWIFLAGASGSILVVAHNPHGSEEVHRLAFSTLIGAGRGDAWTFAALAAAIIPAALYWRRALLLWMLDPWMAAAAGVPVRRLDTAYALVAGMLVGLSLRASGMLYTFACLVLPALAAKHLFRKTAPLFWAAPVVAVGSAMVAFILANEYDYPPAHAQVGLLCVLYLVGRGFRRRG